VDAAMTKWNREMVNPKPMRRRSALTLMSGALMLPLAATAQAQWPRERPLRIIDPSQAGSSTDVMARLIARKLSLRLGQSIIVENRPGAGTALGVDVASKAPPDGYTFLLVSPAVCTNAASGKPLPFDYLRDIVPIGEVAVTPVIIVVPSNSPFRTIGDLVEAARAKPNSILYATAGPGSMSHIGMEFLALTTGTKLKHIPYKGAALAIPDMLNGEVHAALGTVPTFSGLIASGKLRALVVAGTQRSPVLPNVPTAVESGLTNFVIEYWFGLGAPAGTPKEIIARINSELTGIAAEPETRDFLVQMAAVPRSGSQEDFARQNANEVARWRKVIQEGKLAIE
jgi:tripartite-type tricarboxylate transporter receptor subunit TctC